MDDRTVLDKGGKRQLPGWMFATSAADQLKEKVKTDHVDDNDNTEEKIVTKRRKNRKITDKKEAFTEESTTQIPICQTTKRSRRKLNLPNDDCNDECGLTGSECDRMKVNGDGPLPMLRRRKQKTKNSKIEEGAEMEETITEASDKSGLRKRKYSRVKENSNEAGPSSRRQKQKAKNSRNGNCADVEESTPKTDDEDLTVEDLMSIAEEYAGDDDEDLTVEDLMSIAKEYVNESEQAASNKEKSGPMEDAISMSLGSLSDIEVDNQSLRRETNFDSISIQERTIDAPPPKVKMSENPTQDMLDLFLGPLLKKTHEEKRVEQVREEMNFACDLNKNKQSDPSGDRPVVVKKKSSLKDKVALLLD
ncbi:uncharacterized protein LOC132614179 [Lycium barbarum]|uniref:uncharacterized protein LOC132614179 n=1 Tax=Lycium barbarum TaxID=112863 RepID=UPI00293E9DF2|nr:uncharacterized protein LOC132614179 [Lycium barbarum]XP_060184549.1 uncharacterized protein LOC132614179 [Lycium barbarum]XP_060184550.1 uncharacterized protein LOC132614179 [Lycium barbarum]XP_060184551.1 uncharacterized protein LOC132614179 [Lycium barbarum]XP_060184552.1 uncharacterized protein LOC132614179 [Lycium barbarum]XP_060184553.1 uncharacterized protein LOC132614179 [Lycium barbarum]